MGPALFGEGVGFIEFAYAAALVPAFALAHWIPLKARRPMFLANVVFALHIFAFSFLLAPVESLLFVMADGRPILATAFGLVVPIVIGLYWAIALRQFYDTRSRADTVHAVALVYLAFLAVVIPIEILYQLVV